MISDVLSDAIHEIEEYQRDEFDYDDMELEIRKVKIVMEGLRVMLDQPTLNRRWQVLGEALQGLDVSNVEAALPAPAM